MSAARANCPWRICGCAEAGFAKVRTFIASGNVVFSCRKSEAHVKAALEARLGDYAGKKIDVFVRTAAEMAAVAANNPFADAPANRTYAFFLDAPPPCDAIDHVAGRKDERIALGIREIYVHYGEGKGWNRAEHEHRRQARRIGGPTLSSLSPRPR
jgi:uncharacterized protein (DUF1697 family)